MDVVLYKDPLVSEYRGETDDFFTGAQTTMFISNATTNVDETLTAEFIYLTTSDWNVSTSTNTVTLFATNVQNGTTAQAGLETAFCRVTVLATDLCNLQYLTVPAGNGGVYGDWPTPLTTCADSPYKVTAGTACDQANSVEVSGN